MIICLKVSQCYKSVRLRHAIIIKASGLLPIGLLPTIQLSKKTKQCNIRTSICMGERFFRIIPEFRIFEADFPQKASLKLLN